MNTRLKQFEEVCGEGLAMIYESFPLYEQIDICSFCTVDSASATERENATVFVHAALDWLEYEGYIRQPVGRNEVLEYVLTSKGLAVMKVEAKIFDKKEAVGTPLLNGLKENKKEILGKVLETVLEIGGKYALARMGMHE
jgi:hypothetical protein